MEDNAKKHAFEDGTEGRKITRKEALRKAGFYVFSTATMILLFNKPAKSQTEDGSIDYDDPYDPGGPGGW